MLKTLNKINQLRLKQLNQLNLKKAVKAKGGAFVQESPSKSSAITVLESLKSNNIEKGGFQQFAMQRPPAINQSTLQQLIKKH